MEENSGTLLRQRWMGRKKGMVKAMETGRWLGRKKGFFKALKVSKMAVLQAFAAQSDQGTRNFRAY